MQNLKIKVENDNAKFKIIILDILHF